MKIDFFPKGSIGSISIQKNPLSPSSYFFLSNNPYLFGWLVERSINSTFLNIEVFYIREGWEGEKWMLTLFSDEKFMRIRWKRCWIRSFTRVVILVLGCNEANSRRIEIKERWQTDRKVGQCTLYNAVQNPYLDPKRYRFDRSG